MAQLADDLDHLGCETHYLCPKGSTYPKSPGVVLEHHDGIEDYMGRVIEGAPAYDALVMGAAVANLIPWEPIKGKFPSHNYKEGEPIPLTFKIAPRIIDRVKQYAPKAHLFGFKLLSGVNHEELIRAAYEVLLGSRATAVFANDATDLKLKYAVTKERGIHPLKHTDLAGWIYQMILDDYYSTKALKGELSEKASLSLRFLKQLVEKNSESFKQTEGGYLFGTCAVRAEKGFMTTGRGKKELENFVWVMKVDHQKREVTTVGGKATLNAPLLDHIFKNVPEVHYIEHYHWKMALVPTLSYAPPGTVRDTIRNVKGSFNIEGHGCFILRDAEGRQI